MLWPLAMTPFWPQSDPSYQFRNDLVYLFASWKNVTSEVQMIMTFQNPLDWAAEMFYDADNEKLELTKNPELILKTYFNVIEYFLRSCEIINKKFGKLCFMARIEDIMAKPRKFSNFNRSFSAQNFDFWKLKALFFIQKIFILMKRRKSIWKKLWKNEKFYLIKWPMVI